MGKRVLVIDDDDIVRELIVSLLDDAGYETFALPSAIGATQMLLHEQIGILVLDVMMPELRGDKLVALLRANRRLSSLAVVLVSSHSAEQLSALALDVGADALVDKRDLRTDLLSAVARATRAAGTKKQASA